MKYDDAWWSLACCCFAGGIIAVACATAQAPQPNIAGAECVTHRTALQLACVDMYDAGADIDACRARVKAAIDCTRATDGGDQ